MKNIQSYSLKLLFFVFASFSGLAHADTITGKITYYQIYSNANGDNYSVRMGFYTLYAGRANAELLREAFLRKLTVTVNYAVTTCLPNPACGYISTVTIQSADLP
jgi:Ca2+-binding RTX toxin-like protein